ncbi:Vacuolar protein sorting-associated protein 60.2 [Frankliniella fusca]|uniref:Vacuolar protein sorting-associated protein 60.2 n=1 Tax=Frankliniella fusca TaxID=407009 RepID=A0AAE1HG16_9NEOP|nr:Vacuolar protein sorting-associated protein 60.2 [Frankliniella fusca]
MGNLSLLQGQVIKEIYCLSKFLKFLLRVLLKVNADRAGWCHLHHQTIVICQKEEMKKIPFHLCHHIKHPLLCLLKMNSQRSGRLSLRAQVIYEGGLPASNQIVLERLELLNSRVNSLISMQRRILSYVIPEEEQDLNDEFNEDLPSFPLQNSDAFNNFESFLELKSNRRNFVNFLTALFKADATEKEATGKMLQTVISNRLSRLISWGSSGGTKIKFESSRCNSTMRCAILKVFPNSKLSRYENKCQKWFNTSNQRKV